MCTRETDGRTDRWRDRDRETHRETETKILPFKILQLKNAPPKGNTKREREYERERETERKWESDPQEERGFFFSIWKNSTCIFLFAGRQIHGERQFLLVTTHT